MCEMLKFVQTDYAVAISSKRVSRFKAVGSDLEYYVGVEQDSIFE